MARPSRGGLYLLVDSTDVKMLGECEWKVRKHGADDPAVAQGALGRECADARDTGLWGDDNVIGDAPVLPQPLA